MNDWLLGLSFIVAVDYVIATFWSLTKVSRWSTMIDLFMWAYFQIRNSHLNETCTYVRIVFPAPATYRSATANPYALKSEKISRLTRHHRTFGCPSRQCLNILESSSHWPVPSSRSWKISPWISLNLRDSHSATRRRSCSDEKMNNLERNDLSVPYLYWRWHWCVALQLIVEDRCLLWITNWSGGID